MRHRNEDVPTALQFASRFSDFSDQSQRADKKEVTLGLRDVRLSGLVS